MRKCAAIKIMYLQSFVVYSIEYSLSLNFKYVSQSLFLKNPTKSMYFILLPCISGNFLRRRMGVLCEKTIQGL